MTAVLRFLMLLAAVCVSHHAVTAASAERVVHGPLPLPVVASPVASHPIPPGHVRPPGVVPQMPNMVRSHVAVTGPSLASECAQAVTYLQQHANPSFRFLCQPGALGRGVADVTDFDTRTVRISQPWCTVGYEDEASNTWLDWPHITGWQIWDGHTVAGHDDRGRRVDPFGECA